jgi:hypothetical protein
MDDDFPKMVPGEWYAARFSGGIAWRLKLPTNELIMLIYYERDYEAGLPGGWARPSDRENAWESLEEAKAMAVTLARMT